MAKAIISPEDQVRLALYQEMTPSLRKVADDFDKKSADETRGRLLIRYSMGAQIKAIYDDPDTYGHNGVAQLAKYFSELPDNYDALIRLAELYTREDIEALAKRRCGNGRYITLTHVLFLVQLKKSADRKLLTEKVFTENLSSNALAALITSEYERSETRNPGGGRKPTTPSSPQAGAQQIEKLYQKVHNKMDGWQDVVFDTVDKLGADQANATLLKKLQLADQAANTAEGDITQIRSRLAKNIARVSKIVQGKEQAAAKAAKANKAEARKLDGDEDAPARGRPVPATAAV